MSSLRILGSVGEPINIDAWNWFFNVIGRRRCPIMDTWWQTETGGIAIAPLLNIGNLKPCYASKPFFGVKVHIGHDGMLSVHGSCNFGNLISGDRALADENGDIKIIGRIDDVINVSGHRLGASEIEDVINSVKGVVESAVVGVPHEIKGQSIFVFAVKSSDIESDILVQDIVKTVRQQLSSIAKPNDIVFVQALPKTRSGKIKRNLLQKIASGEEISDSDLETLANGECVNSIQLSVANAIPCPDFCLITPCQSGK